MKKRKFFKIFKRIVFCFTILVIVASFSSFLYISNQIPPEIEEIKNIELKDEDGETYLSLSNNQKKTWIGINEIGNKVIDSFVSIEDKNFYSHEGFDSKRIVKAFFNNIKAGSSVEGASTITQQYVKNLFLTSEKTIDRKLKEFIYAIQIENNYTKDEILEGYLNSIYFGHGMYGIYDASLYYFNTAPKNLTYAQSSILAAIPKGPSLYSPIHNPNNNEARMKLVLDALYNEKKIDIIDYEAAINEQVEIIGINRNNSYENSPYFQDKVLEELALLDIDSKHKTLGLNVYTTLDSDLNQEIVKSVETHTTNQDLQTAVVAQDPQTGYVKGLVGGNDYNTSTYNRAIKANRHPASTVKPFLYYEALEYGFTATTTFMSAPTTFYVDNGNNVYAPTNFGDIYPYQDVSMAYSVATSDNIYAVKTHLFLGEERLSNRLNSLGVDATPLPSLALGATDTTLEKMTNAYSHLANGGYTVDPVYITKVTDSNGEVLYEHIPEHERILSEDSVFILNDIMRGVFDTRLAININVTGSSLTHKITNTYAAKSGSTDYDNWMIGYNPQINIGVWSGYDDNTEVTELEERIISKNVWFDSIEYYMQDKEDIWYSVPSNLRKHLVDPINGEMPFGLSYSKYIYYKTGSEPYYY